MVNKLKKLSRIISSTLSKNFNSEEIVYIARELERNFDIYEVSGFPSSMRLPAKDTADVVCRFFLEKKLLTELVNVILGLNNKQFRGKMVYLKDIGTLAKAIEDMGYEYSKESKGIDRKSVV